LLEAGGGVETATYADAAGGVDAGGKAVLFAAFDMVCRMNEGGPCPVVSGFFNDTLLVCR
jgi:hypothetical protein